MKINLKTAMILVCTVLINACASTTHDLTEFTQVNTACYDRENQPYTAVVDSHIHFRAFGGASIPFTELNDYFKDTGVFLVPKLWLGNAYPQALLGVRGI
jgi:hypothetical protein